MDERISFIGISGLILKFVSAVNTKPDLFESRENNVEETSTDMQGNCALRKKNKYKYFGSYPSRFLPKFYN
jgi:hypothetical protein